MIVANEPETEERKMDEFENQDPIYEEEIPQEEPLTQAEEYEYRGGGTGRRESPFADSPYEMDPNRGHRYEAPTTSQLAFPWQ